MKTLVTAAVLLLFAVSTAVSAGGPAEKKAKKTVTSERKSGGGAWLGVSLGDYALRSSDEEKEQKKEGALIREVTDDSPADSVGLKEDDVIIEINGKTVATASDVVERIGALKPGDKASITVLRGDARKSFTAVLGSRPQMRERFSMRMPRTPMMPMPPAHAQGAPLFGIEGRAGVEGMKLMVLRDQLGRYFEAPDGRALLVTEVKKNSNARKAGIEAGDVITKVGSTDIEDMGDLHEALKDAKEGSTVDVQIIRKGAHKTMKLEVSQKPEREMGMMFDFDHEAFPQMDDFQFDFDTHHFDRDALREMLRDLKPQIEKIKPEIEKMKKEIRIRMRGERV
ncbi:MAG: PDZ domain-containing protein [Acidobacteriota bacterium]